MEQGQVQGMVKLTKGRVRILSLLEKWGILGLGQLDGFLSEGKLERKERMELFFNSKPKDGYRGMTYKAVSRIEDLGFVRSHSYTNLPQVYTLTAKGHGALRKEGLNKLPSYCPEVAETLVRHELTVSATGLVLAELLGLRVWTELERYLLSAGGKSLSRKDFGLSDLWIEDQDQPKAIEVERTQKSAKRYASLWESYRNDLPRNGVVLYIVCFPGGAERLRRFAEKFRADHVYFCSLEDFRASLGRGPFVGYRGGEITLGGQGGAWS